MYNQSNHKILNIASVDVRLQDTLSRDCGISRITAQVLINRGIKSSEEAQNFLDARLDNLLDPFSFADMPEAVRLLRHAVRDGEEIMLFGDYDVDGITGVALLETVLSQMGAQVRHYLPHRINEGYGLNRNVVTLIKQKRIKFLITVDCGMSNRKEIEELKKHGVLTIITDHHEAAGKDLPPAFCILNPKVKSSNYKYRDLAGVGVAYKLCQALKDSTLEEDLDLVVLGTIADSAPLTGENRIIAKAGLKRLPQTERVGLKALIENAGIANKKFNSTFVSFILGPRLNASGRMDSAQLSLDLLLSQDYQRACKLARTLEQHNRKRQEIENRVLEEARDLINKEINFKEHKVIVVGGENWHHGVLGIVASKLKDAFYRPAVVISLSEGLCKGSGRSIKNFHLFEALSECQRHLKTFGGHSHAAGLLISRENIKDFKESINRLAEQNLSWENLLPLIEVDMELRFADLNAQVLEELEGLEPYGESNAEPLFLTRNLKLKKQPQVLSRQTLKFWVTDGLLTMPAIGFGMADFKESLIASESFDLVYTPRIDNWQGERSILLEIRDIFFGRG